jgi:hypothetical protein
LCLLAIAWGLAACGTPPPGKSSTGAATGHCPATAGLPANVSDHGAAAGSGNQPAIEANDFFFKATCVTQVPVGTVTLTVHNAGRALHNVSIPSLNVDMGVAAGQTISVKLMMGNTPLIYFCKYHKSVGVYGALLPSGTALCCCCSSGSGCPGMLGALSLQRGT